MQIHLWGSDFRRTTQDQRARLFLSPQQRSPLLQEWVSEGLSDLVYLHTCNRVEFFTTVKDPFKDTRRFWEDKIARLTGDSELFYQGYYLEGKSALRHLLRVASSLESMVVGEPQILGQLKESLLFSKENQIAPEAHLERCFQLAFQTAKRIRTETEIAQGSVSVAALAIRLLKKQEALVPLSHVVLVGRGKMPLTYLKWLRDNRPDIPITWVNRSPEKIESKAKQFNAEVLSLRNFLGRPIEFSHLITATASAEPLFDANFFERLPSTRARLVFDLAQPQDVALSETPESIRLFQMADFAQEAAENTEARERSVTQAERLIDEALRTYYIEQKEAPVLQDFGSVEPLFLEEMKNALQSIASELPDPVRPKIDEWARKLVKKNVHVSREHLRHVLRHAAQVDPKVVP